MNDKVRLHFLVANMQGAAHLLVSSRWRVTIHIAGGILKEFVVREVRLVVCITYYYLKFCVPLLSEQLRRVALNTPWKTAQPKFAGVAVFIEICYWVRGFEHAFSGIHRGARLGSWK
jgi:hypothetical protein